MFGRVLSALFSFGGFFLKGALAKFFLFFGLFFVTTEFLEYLAPMLPGADVIQQAFDDLPDGMWYFLNILQVPTGLAVGVSAMTLRFLIRRIPIIG